MVISVATLSYVANSAQAASDRVLLVLPLHDLCHREHPSEARQDSAAHHSQRIVRDVLTVRDSPAAHLIIARSETPMAGNPNVTHRDRATRSDARLKHRSSSLPRNDTAVGASR